jgi:hypothetical protein
MEKNKGIASSAAGQSPSQLIDARIREALIREAIALTRRQSTRINWVIADHADECGATEPTR